MNTTDLTTLVADMRGRMADLAAGYGPTDQAGLRAMASWYKSILTDAARKAVYRPERYLALAVEILDGTIDLNTREERRVATIARDAWDVLLAGATGEALVGGHRAAYGVALTPGTPIAKRVKGVAFDAARLEKAWAHDLTDFLAEVAAKGIAKNVTAGTAAPVTGNQYRYPVMDIPGMEALVRFIADLAPALTPVKPAEVGVKKSVLRQAAQDALAPMRDGRGGITRDEHRAARKAAVAGEYHDLLAGRSAGALNEDIDIPVEDEVVSPWTLALPHFLPFGVKSEEELMVIIDEMLDVKPEGSKRGAIAHYAQSEAESKHLRRAAAKVRKNVATLQPVLVSLFA